jgi:hypothetical protein
VSALSSLDDELRDLGLDSDQQGADAGASKKSASIAAEEPSVTVVAPDAIILSDRQQGEEGHFQSMITSNHKQLPILVRSKERVH